MTQKCETRLVTRVIPASIKFVKVNYTSVAFNLF